MRASKRVYFPSVDVKFKVKFFLSFNFCALIGELLNATFEDKEKSANAESNLESYLIKRTMALFFFRSSVNKPEISLFRSKKWTNNIFCWEYFRMSFLFLRAYPSLYWLNNRIKLWFIVRYSLYLNLLT